MNTTKYTNEFEFALNRLNKEQKKAVNTLDGPVMVVAGPGTGKTQILAARIGKILQDTDAQPSNILCLTYTDTGRIEMRKRLITMIGPAAYRVAIHTFHSFCNEIIQENLTAFGKLNLDLISELESIELMHELIDEIHQDNILKRFSSSPYYDMGKFKNLFSRMKKEAMTPDYLSTRIDQYVQAIPFMEEFVYKKKRTDKSTGITSNPGDLKQGGKKELENMEKLKAAVALYPSYQAKMKSKNRYTYDDMILWVLDIFEKDKDFLLNYQERYQYFLIDEFQDTSGAQSKLIYYLINYFDNPDVFIVGDDDQSIFSFQDANVKNIIEFNTTFNNTITKVVLEENYRSSQNILDVAKTLISSNVERIETDKTLIAKSEKIKDLKLLPKIIEYKSIATETVGIAMQIEKLIANGVSSNEIAVLYRNHKDVSDLAQYLTNVKIPIFLVQKSNLLSYSLIEQIVSIIKYVEEELISPYNGDQTLFKILHYPFFNIRPIEIAQIALSTSQKKYANYAEKKKDIYSLRVAISEQIPIEKQTTLFNQAPVSNVKKVSDILEGLIADAASCTLQQFFENLLYKCGILNFSLVANDKFTSLQLINNFFDYLKSETQKNNLNIHEFVKNLDLLIENEIKIPFYKMDGEEKGVKMMTAHASKGAEFEHVFIINCTAKTWGLKRASSHEFKLPKQVISDHEIELLSPLEEERRLFYVAITRAKTNLTMSYYIQDEQEKKVERTQFIEEIIGEGVELINETITEEDLVKFYSTKFQRNEPPKLELIDSNYINERLKNYSLSVTHLNNFLKCPISFYFQNIIKVPSAKNASMTFGSAVHFALEKLFRKMQESENQKFPSKDIFLNDFNWFMSKNTQSFTEEEFKLKSIYGAKILPAYYDAKINEWKTNVLVEKSILNIEVSGVPINGKLDRIDILGNNASVIDYKTGNFDKAKKKVNPPNEKDEIGGDYWRQAVFYKILMDNDSKNDKNVTNTIFDFIEPIQNEHKNLEVKVGKSDIDKVTEQIISTWDKIKNHEFNIGCGKKECDWCNFVKTNTIDANKQEFYAESEEEF